MAAAEFMISEDLSYPEDIVVVCPAQVLIFSLYVLYFEIVPKLWKKRE